jgi:LacI family transcriptional regulator
LKKRITIKDLARELGVAPSTISRALKDSPEINSETKKRVKALAEKLNYVPDSIAISLRNQRTNSIGILLPEFVHFFFSTVVSGIEDVAYAKGYQVFVTQSNELYDKEVVDCIGLQNTRADGFLLCVSKNTKNFDHIRALINKGFPVVLFDRGIPELDCSTVKVNDIKGGYLATKHLIDQGCKRIAFVSGPAHLVSIKERKHGYVKAMNEAGLLIDEKLEIMVDYPVNTEDKLQLLTDLLTNEKPDGIFVHNDMVAIELLEIAKKNNVKVPEQAKIIGFSNWFFTKYTTPSLTTIEQNGFEIGRKAAELLLEEIHHNAQEKGFIEPQTIELEPSLIVRDSTAKA